MSRLLLRNLPLLAHLDALVTERHVTRAAEKMGIGQPAMSGALARLRTIFNDPILVKTGAGMEPTLRALALVKQVNEVLALLEQAALAGTEFDPAQATHSFKIMASDSIAQACLPPMLKVVRKAAPHMRFTVMPGDVRRVLEALRDSELDLVLGYIRQPPSGLYHVQLYTQRLLCIAAREHPVIRGKLSLKQFCELQHVAWGAPPAPVISIEAMVDSALAERGEVRDVVVRVPNVLLLPRVVASSDLLAIVTERVATQTSHRNSLQVLPIPFSLDRIDVSMYWHERRHRDPAHGWLRAILEDVAKAI